MRRGLLLLALTLTACTHSDQDRAKDKAKEAEGQLKRDAEKASREIKRDAEEAKQKIGQGLEKAGREMQGNGDTKKRTDRADDPHHRR